VCSSDLLIPFHTHGSAELVLKRIRNGTTMEPERRIGKCPRL